MLTQQPAAVNPHEEGLPDGAPHSGLHKPKSPTGAQVCQTEPQMVAGFFVSEQCEEPLG